jgi:hypothetical protein
MNEEANAKVESRTVPMVNDIFEGSDLKSFSIRVQRRISLKDMIKIMEKEIEEIDERLTGQLASKDSIVVAWGDYRVEIVSKTNNRLVKEKLIENGVSAQVIANSMVTSYSSYLQVREIKSSKDE